VGFLKRIFGSSDPPQDVQLPPVRYRGPHVALGGIHCPYCGVRLDFGRMPRKCRACKNTLATLPTEFPLVTYARIEDVDPAEVARVEAYGSEEYEARTEYAAQIPTRPRHLREVRKRQLQRAAALGLYVTFEVHDADRTCKPCKALEGQRMPAGMAPVLPYEQCTANYICDCEYRWEFADLVPLPPFEPGTPTG
jgi:hypothetical protein